VKAKQRRGRDEGSAIEQRRENDPTVKEVELKERKVVSEEEKRRWERKKDERTV